jgi:hypothetical protein
MKAKPGCFQYYHTIELLNSVVITNSYASGGFG